MPSDHIRPDRSAVESMPSIYCLSILSYGCSVVIGAARLMPVRETSLSVATITARGRAVSLFLVAHPPESSLFPSSLITGFHLSPPYSAGRPHTFPSGVTKPVRNLVIAPLCRATCRAPPDDLVPCPLLVQEPWKAAKMSPRYSAELLSIVEDEVERGGMALHERRESGLCPPARGFALVPRS